MIKSLPIQENPREKAINYGINSLNDTELMALVLRTGNRQESVIELSERLLKEIGGIEHLKDVSYGKLISLKGIKKAKAIELLSVVELCKRMSTRRLPGLKISSPDDVYNLLKGEMTSLKQEHVVILILDSKNRVICKKTVFVGCVNASLVSNREIFQETLAVNGVAVVCIHNHPSGDAHPSKEDEEATEKLIQSGLIMNIDVIDHIIIGHHQYYSFMADTIYEE